MITSITGILAEATPLRAVLDLNGLGYEVHIPVTTAEKLPANGSKVKLHTVVIYREDNQTLYGFATTEERDFFRLMIEHVSGIGPKLAQTIMSKMSMPVLQAAIASGDVASLSKCPGIGKKTAERLVIELRSKVGTSTDSSGMEVSVGSKGALSPVSPVSDAVSALITLGYKQADADAAVRKAAVAVGDNATTEQLIKKALGR